MEKPSQSMFDSNMQYSTYKDVNPHVLVYDNLGIELSSCIACP